MQWLILILLLFIAFYFVGVAVSAVKCTRNTVVCFTGGLGSGKTYLAVNKACKAYKRALFKVRLYNLFHPKKKKSLPLLLSNIPIRIKRNKWSSVLTREHLLLKSRIPEYSVVVIDELGQVASQYDYDNPLVMTELQEFIRFFRHYIDGRLFLTDQSSANIVVPIRRRINLIYNLNDFGRYGLFLPFYKVSVSPLEVCEESISNTNTMTPSKKGILFQKEEYQKPYFFGYLPYKWQKKKRKYDSRCYSIMYKAMIIGVSVFEQFKTDKIIDLSCTLLEKKNFKERNKK